MKNIYIGICLTLLAMQHITAQDVQVNGKTFQTVKKTVLNAETEFFQLKEKGKSGRSASQNYIKTKGAYYETIFTENELKNFVSTGELSNLGKIVKRQFSKGNKIAFIDKGDVVIILWIKNNQLKFIEISQIDMVRRLKPTVKGRLAGSSGDSNQPTNDDYIRCRDDCMNTLDNPNDPTDIGCIDEGDGACNEWLGECVFACMDKHPDRTTGTGLHSYSFPVKGLSIKIKF